MDALLENPTCNKPNVTKEAQMSKMDVSHVREMEIAAATLS